MPAKNVFGTLRVVAGCALLGAILCGAFLSWVEVQGGIRAYGAAVGAVAGVYATRPRRK